MASKELTEIVKQINHYVSTRGLDENIIEGSVEACKIAYLKDKDIAYGKALSEATKGFIHNQIAIDTGGKDFKALEEWAQANKEQISLIKFYYDTLLLEAPFFVDSFKLYIEKDRPRRERFYEPRRKTLLQVSDAFQRLEDDKLDILFLHMPARTGKLLADDTIVFTADGWKKHGDLCVGDRVVGSEGGFIDVKKVHPKDKANMRVELSNGEVFYCHQNHEWTVYTKDRNGFSWRTLETMMIANLLKQNVPVVLPKEKTADGYETGEWFISCVFCEPRRGNCITVDSEDGLYAVGKTMQLTHNSGDSTMDVAWHCARNMEQSNLYVTYKEGLGGAFLDGVMEIMKDPTYKFRDVFPDAEIVYTDAKNNKLDLGRKKKYRSLSGKGLESGLNGEYDATGLLIIDDPLEGVQDVLSPEVLKRKQTIFDNNVLSRKKEKCKLFLIGTLWGTSDILSNYREYLETVAQQIRFEVIKIPALDPDTDESNFVYDYGVGFSTEYYRQQRAKHEMNDDMAGWMCQYQQTPIDREGAVFNPEHMNYYTELPSEKPLKVIAHGDTALGGEDYTAFPVIYVYEDGSMYCVDVVFDNGEKHVTQPQILAMIKKHNIRHNHFESNQGGEFYAEDIKRMVLADETIPDRDLIAKNIRTDWAPSTKSKEQRIWDNAQDIRQIYFKEPQLRDMPYRKFMQNLFSFTMKKSKHKHDDAADSLAGAMDFCRSGSGVSVAMTVKSPF